MSRGKYKHANTQPLSSSVCLILLHRNKKILPARIFFFCDSLSFIYFGHRYAFSLIFKFTDGVLVAAL